MGKSGCPLHLKLHKSGNKHKASKSWGLLGPEVKTGPQTVAVPASEQTAELAS